MAGTIMGTIGETIERADSQAYSEYMEADGKLESGVALAKSVAISETSMTFTLVTTVLP